MRLRQPPSGAYRPLPSGARRALWTRPVVQFAAAGLVALIVLVVGTQWLTKRAATEEAINNARSTTELLAQSVAGPGMPAGLIDMESAALDRFDRLARHRLLVGDVLRVKVWTRSGQIVYSDESRLIGGQFTLGPEEVAVLRSGGTDAEVSDLGEPENRFERDFGRLLEVYTQVHSPEGEPLLFEAYYSYDDVSRRSAEVLGAFRPITVAALMLFMLLTVPLVWVLARRLDAAAAQRERLLVAAVDASDAERRRIARDLHDGVVQDLAGISFAASATARGIADRPESAARLESLAARVRQSLRALRSLLVEIYPPDLQTAGLAAALDDLVAPASAAGMRVELDVSDVSQIRAETTALLWRVAQESVRNVMKHAQATSLAIKVSREADEVLLRVADDGLGFDVDQVPSGDALGLKGLRGLVAESGGRLSVDSEPGVGTQVSLVAIA